VNFAKVADPSSKEYAEARAAIDAVDSAKVLNEMPGTIHVEVADADAPRLKQSFDHVHDWDVADEGMASLGPSRGLDSSSK